MPSVFRRCGCRRADGTNFGPLPERATPAQRANACPRLVRDTKHGSWGIFVSAKVDSATQKRVQIRRMGFGTKREAQQALAAAVQEVASKPEGGGQGRTLEVWLTEWIDRRERDGLRAATVAGYRRYIAKDINPAIGHIMLRDLRRHHVDSFLQTLLRDGRGITTVHRIHAVLSSCLTMAVRLDLVTMNAASNITLPRERTEKLRVWEPAEVRSFLEAARAHRLSPVFELVVRTGLRRGEIAGLRWQDVDLDASRLVVRQQRVQVDTVVVTNHAKTDHGQDCRVTLDATAVRALRDWRTQQDRERKVWTHWRADDGWVFTYDDGRPLNPYYISDVFRKLVAQAGLPQLTFHGLRHEHASLLLSAGVSITAVSKRLGHASAAITSDLYSHLLDDADRQMADAVESVLGAPDPTAHTLHTQWPQGHRKGPIIQREMLF
jgi:integrase